MKISAHVGISAVVSLAVYKFAESGTIAISLFIGGVLIDLDHLADYILLAREKFSIRNFFSWYHDRRWRKIYIIFHSYELMAVVVALSFWLRNTAAIGIASGCLLHLLLDQIGNSGKKEERLSPWFYFFSYRCYAGFEKKNLTAEKPTT